MVTSLADASLKKITAQNLAAKYRGKKEIYS